MAPRPLTALVLAATCALALGCSASSDDDADPSSDASSAGSPTPLEPSAPAESTESAPEPAPEPDADLPAVTSRVSLPALMRQEPTPSRIRRGAVLERTADYTRYAVTYRSDGATVSGVLLRPPDAVRSRVSSSTTATSSRRST